MVNPQNSARRMDAQTKIWLGHTFRKVGAAQIRNGTFTHFAKPTTIIRENWRSPPHINWFPQTRVKPAVKCVAIKRAENIFERDACYARAPHTPLKMSVRSDLWEVKNGLGVGPR